MPTPGAWLAAFLLTYAVEAPIVLVLTRGTDAGLARRAALILFAQLATHPLVWFIFPYIVGLRGGTATLLSELWAWLAEAVFYALAFRGLKPLRALATSALANGVSVVVGVLWSHLR